MSTTARTLLVGVALGLLSMNMAMSAEQELTLVRDGNPAATIVLAEPAARAAQLGAYELQHHVKLITGATLPIVREPDTVTGTRVLVGESRATHRLGVSPGKLSEQEYLIQFLPDTLVLMGVDKADYGEVVYDAENLAVCKGFPGFFDEQGTMHAVYDFLRRYCGVRWFDSTELGMSYPETSTLTVRGSEVQRKPFFRYRHSMGSSSSNPVFYDRGSTPWPTGTPEYQAWTDESYPGLRERYQNQRQFEAARVTMSRLFLLRMGEGGAPAVCNHSLYGYYDRYLEQTWTDRLANAKDDKEREAILARKAQRFEGDHPEYFAQGYEGQPPQLCYTNPEVVKQLAQDARDYYDGKSTGGEQGIFWNPTLPNPFPIEAMDGGGFCRCDRCRALYEKSAAQRKEVYSTGHYSDYWFQFVNAVVKELNKTHPDAKVITLAYSGHAARPSFPVDPNVIVEFCMASTYAPYSKADYENDLQLLREWANDGTNRDLYLWRYDAMAVYFGNNGKYHAFPEFFAHAIGEQMKLYHELGVKGMFYCGRPRGVDAYVAFRLMDDPTLQVGHLLNDYFTRMYGPAGDPMKQMYLALEKTYCDPELRPRGESGPAVAWGYLGTEERMAEWQALLDEAKRKAETDLQKRRIAAFERGIWSYMTVGREKYMERMTAPIPTVSVPKLAAAGGDPGKVNWESAASLPGSWYDRGGATPSKRSYAARVAHDGEYLYLELTDKCDPGKLIISGNVFPFDDWEVFVAKQRAQPYRQYSSGPSGLTVATSWGEIDWRPNMPITDSKFKVVSDTSAPDEWVTHMVWPLDDIVVGGREPGESLYMNIIRVLSPGLGGQSPYGIDTWISHCTVHEVDRLGELKLEK